MGEGWEGWVVVVWGVALGWGDGWGSPAGLSLLPPVALTLTLSPSPLGPGLRRDDGVFRLDDGVFLRKRIDDE